MFFGSRAEFPTWFLAKNPARSTRYRTVRRVRFAPKSWADSGLPSRPGNWDTCARHARRRMTGDTTHLSVSSCARRCTQPASSAVVVSTVGGCALVRVFMGLGSQSWWLHWAGQSCTLHLCMRGVLQHIGRHFASRPRASSSLFCLWGDVSESGREGGEEPSLHRACLLHRAGT